VNLKEALEVEVRYLLAVLDTEELAKLRVGKDAALERGVKAVVRLDVARDELGYIRLALLRLGRKAHEGAELIRKRAELEERVVGTAGIVGRALLDVKRRGVNLTALLGVTGITLDRLDSLLRIVDRRANTRREL